MTDGVPSAVLLHLGAARRVPSVASQRGRRCARSAPSGRAPADLGVHPGGRVAGPAKGFWRTSFERLIHNRVSMAALVVLVLMAIASFSAPLVAQAMGLDRDAMDLTNRYLLPPRALVRDGRVRAGLLHPHPLRGQVSFLMGLGVATVARYRHPSGPTAG